MYAILILSVLAAATAAPHYHHHHHQHRPFGPPSHEPYPGFGQDIFDTTTFWNELAKEMQQLDEMLKNFYVRFPSSVSKEVIEGNQYKIVIPLAGYNEKDIAVKAREGVLMVQAVQKFEGGSQRSYIDVRTLPDRIELSGTWTYDNDVLNIQFPLKPDASTPPTATEETLFTTAAPEISKAESREQMEDDDDDVQNVDVGVRGDNDKNIEILTNEIPVRNNVEATTYAVDLHNEVEFVPVPY